MWYRIGIVYLVSEAPPALRGFLDVYQVRFDHQQVLLS